MDKKLLRLLGSEDYIPSNVPELLSQLGMKPNQQQVLQSLLKSLEKQGKIVRTKGNRYIVAKEADLVPGVIQITRGGRGFVQPDEAGITEIGISESNTGTAMHGDRVLVRLDVRPGQADKIGSVVRVLERKRTQFVGTLQRSKQFLHVTPDDPRLPGAIYVSEPRDVGRKPNVGDKVVVEITQWESKQTAPEGEIIEVLGPPDEEGVDMLSVLRHYDLPLHFPKNVLHEANTIAKSRADNQPSAQECAGRVDCRSHNVITIDPDDAKDFDDAICLQKQGDQWQLWVHIADVSHYVMPGSALDIEARKRGNSTYLVDRVIPMLPEALSNELCSLKPNVDRLTKCVEFVLSKDGHVVSSKFYAAVIRSKRRFTYKEAFAAIQVPPNNETEQMLHDAHAMAQKVRHLRFKNGSLDLDFPENKIRLDEHGKVLRIERIENDVSHQLIEEYMLLANEAVAGRLMGLDRPSVYRVHESPKEKRLNDYREDVLSHRVPCGNLTHRPEVQKLLSRLDTLPIGPALKIGFLRSMMRARYAVEPLGHYGLAKTKYTHFTSPIRRYADLVVHRSLFDKVELQVGVAKQIADHISTTEKNSSDAERDSKEVKLYAYLKAQLVSKKPQPYVALVTDVRNFGFFVDVPDLGLSGGVPLSSIQDDFYVFDPATRQVTGRHTRKVISIGDNLVVQIYKVDTIKKQVDFMPVPQRGKPTRSNDPERQDRRGPSSRDPKRPSAPPRKPGHGHKRASQQPKKRR
ncbi:MAG: ribonuclease R [Prosthecobacter sp.]|uniref:ribonuclease R n=1 Tax=Prosthecobacter sp. TaxID=1965333 RepID=UPI003BAF92DC